MDHGIALHVLDRAQFSSQASADFMVITGSGESARGAGWVYRTEDGHFDARRWNPAEPVGIYPTLDQAADAIAEAHGS
jgi:hypothetical protein